MFSVILKSLILGIYCLVSSYVFSFGKSKSGIKLDYLFFSIFVVIALVRL